MGGGVRALFAWRAAPSYEVGVWFASRSTRGQMQRLRPRAGMRTKFWLQGSDSNRRPHGYEPSGLTSCPTLQQRSDHEETIMKMVSGDGVEPPTLGSSNRRSTAELPGRNSL